MPDPVQDRLTSLHGGFFECAPRRPSCPSEHSGSPAIHLIVTAKNARSRRLRKLLTAVSGSSLRGRPSGLVETAATIMAVMARREGETALATGAHPVEIGRRPISAGKTPFVSGGLDQSSRGAIAAMILKLHGPGRSRLLDRETAAEIARGARCTWLRRHGAGGCDGTA